MESIGWKLYMYLESMYPQLVTVDHLCAHVHTESEPTQQVLDELKSEGLVKEYCSGYWQVLRARGQRASKEEPFVPTLAWIDEDKEEC